MNPWDKYNMLEVVEKTKKKRIKVTYGSLNVTVEMILPDKNVTIRIYCRGVRRSLESV